MTASNSILRRQKWHEAKTLLKKNNKKYMILDMIKVQQRRKWRLLNYRETTERNSRRWHCSKDDYKAKRRSVATVNDYKAKCPSPCLEKLVMVKGIPTICSKIKLSTSLKQLVIQKSPSLLQLLYLIFQNFNILRMHT